MREQDEDAMIDWADSVIDEPDYQDRFIEDHDMLYANWLWKNKVPKDAEEIQDGIWESRVIRHEFIMAHYNVVLDWLYEQYTPPEPEYDNEGDL